MAQKKQNGPTKLADLSPNPLNPRQISPERLAMLKDSLAEFGDLSGFVLNRRTGRLVGGHQRQKVLRPEARVQVEQTFPKPTKTGTMALGHVQVDGERFAYREVDWPERKEKAAMLAANQHGGEWIEADLAAILRGLEADERLLAGFDQIDMAELGLDVAGGQIDTDAARLTLAERFGVPPFSVLDARQGYWQARKSAWLALGIKSEIGRGGTPSTSARAKPGRKPSYREIRTGVGRASPGGSLRPACDYSKRQRGDGRGRPIG